MKVEIPEERIENWKQRIEALGYDAPDCPAEWLTLLSNLMDDEYPPD